MLLYSLSVVLLAMLHFIFCQKVDKYTDENRPYKFGFNIDGYQHRKEEKNEKGIIKGEYGFITADGYYRVTKYETDENGNFRIISMKNYYVGFPPENPTTLPSPSFSQSIPPQKFKKLNEPKLNSVFDKKISKENKKLDPIKSNLLATTISPAKFATTKSTVTTNGPTTKRPFSFQGQAGCSHCIIPTTKGPPKSDPKNYIVDYRVDLNFLQTSSENPEDLPKNISAPEDQNELLSENPLLVKDTPNFKSSNHSSNDEGRNNNKPIDFKNHKFPKLTKDIPVGGLPLTFNNETVSNYERRVENTFNNTSEEKIQLSTETPVSANITSQKNNFASRNDLEKFKTSTVPNIALKSALNSTEILSDRNAQNKLLYTFNYTVDFHGHHEDGFRNGEKEGDYYVGGKDGVQRKVNYLANEFGYQPNITLSDLDDNTRSRIHESNEKHSGLKGYEFKWFYRK